MTSGLYALFSLFVILVHAGGIVSALHAIMSTRSSQSAIAWGLSLVIFPYVALPLYWVFGRSRFAGYIEERQAARVPAHLLEDARNGCSDELMSRLAPERHGLQLVCEQLAEYSFTHGNHLELLIDGEATFAAIFAAIDAAQSYILLEYFIVHDDELGRALKNKLIARAQDGIRIHCVYDAIGSHDLPEAYAEELRRAGVRIHAFRSSQGYVNRFQVNFRNHRKITLIDGHTAFVGGHNVGDEYLGKSPKLGPWRDTTVRISGPAVAGIQVAWLEDYYWAAEEAPELDWHAAFRQHGGCDALPLATGPAFALENCALYFLAMIDAARQRLWLSSPYFVPDEPVVNALRLAALRGVDVRIILPSYPDHYSSWLAGYHFVDLMLKAGVKVFRYQPGFPHQKIVLVDDDLASVGTANLDNRSFRLNFELTVLVADRDFAQAVAAMLERDLAHCRPATAAEYEHRSFLFKAAVSFARLLSPIL